MISPENIKTNAINYYNNAKTYEFYSDKLVELLGTEFITAPATNDTIYPYCYDGGLIQSIFAISELATQLNNILSLDNKQDINSLMKVCHLCQIGKANLYITNPSEWHRKNTTKQYEYNQELQSMTIGERSILYCIKSDIKLTDDEYVAILNHSKPETDTILNHNSKIGFILRQAITLNKINKK